MLYNFNTAALCCRRSSRINTVLIQKGCVN